jgi:virulence-associated protein VapD
MQKVRVVFDEQKILQEKRYSLSKISKAVDSVFVDRYGLVKGEDGFYLESGNSDDFTGFWSAILLLKDQDWFMENVKTWLWYNSDDSLNPEDFVIEDIKSHYSAVYSVSA